MIHWFWTDEAYSRPDFDCWVPDPSTYQWPMHLMAGDHMNGVMMDRYTVFNSWEDAEKVKAKPEVKA